MKLSTPGAVFMLYCFSFILPVFTDLETLGAQAFYLALATIFKYPFAAISWFANVFFAAALIANNKKNKALFSFLSIILALIVILEPTIDITNSGFYGHHTLFLSYYCWLLSFTILFIHDYSIYLNQKKSHQQSQMG